MPKLLRVLILEDRPMDAELMLRALRHAGYEPQWERVDTKADFLARLNPDWDLILSDYRMPQFDGLQALQLLQQRGLDIPFIIVSGTIGEDTAVAAMRAGAVDYLLKDRLTRLHQAVEHALEEKRRREESRLVSEALIEAEQKYRSLFNNVVEGIYQSTPAGRFILANPSLARLLGYASPLELLNIPNIGQQLYVDPQQRTELLRLLEERGEVTGFEVQIRRKDGRVIWVEHNVRATRDNQGHLLYCDGTVTDITGRKQAEEMLRQQTAELRVRNAELERFNHAVVGRELRMIELKQEVNKLCHQLGVAARYQLPEQSGKTPNGPQGDL